MKQGIEQGRYWDFGWQLVEGCTKCSPGCENCWSLAKEKRFRKESGVVFHPERLDRPLKRKKPASYAIWNDLFHDAVKNTQIYETLNIIELCKQHKFYLLTKRPDRMVQIFGGTSGAGLSAPGLENLFVGVTVCNQKEADEKIPLLLQIPAAKKWVSIEPMLGPINIAQYLYSDYDKAAMDNQLLKPLQGFNYSKLSWLVVGAESGTRKRFCGPGWIHSIASQCDLAGVKCFVKQIHIEQSRGCFRVSKDMTEWPESLRVREMI